MTQSTAIDQNTVLTRVEGLVFSEIDDEITMLNIENGKYYGLTQVAAAIWKLIETPTPVSEVCGQLMRTYNVEQKQCQAEVLELLHHLAAENLITLQQ